MLLWVFDSLWMRAGAACLLAACATLVLGPSVIGHLQRHLRERIDSASASLNALHASKNATPTMGGVLLVGAILVSTILCADLANPAVWISILTVAGFAVLGGADDWIKSKTHRRGLTSRQKLAAQVALACFAAVLFQFLKPWDATFAPKWLSSSAVILAVLSPVWVALVLTAASNAVNLADGLDGLAGGCGIAAAAVMTIVGLVASQPALAASAGIAWTPAAGELSVILAALCGTLLAFLKFNRHPARVFMGDAGSLPIGALLGMAGVVSQQPLLLALSCGVFVVETLSVILQVGWFKATGKRLIRCSPLHNHFVLAGWSEPRVVGHFWLASLGCAAIAVAVLWIR
jgi:phospho-N-acetylmuramoyl-pentapeptide-transferase